MADAAIGNVREYTVSELSGAVKRTIEDSFGFVRVRGELGRVTRAASGHVYLDLKDEKAVISGVMWKGMAARLAINPEQGMEVVASGRMSTFPGQSRYQLIIDTLEPAGVGALMALFEERKKKLAAEGLFAPERKQPLPFLPDVIGVVTSPSGAVIRDILHRLRERFPRHVIVWPTLVQGRGAAEKIAEAIDGFNAL
ncbi:MAG: exodeoxyribonuclease VII large subunit, partial [Hyphococcus sp.]